MGSTRITLDRLSWVFLATALALLAALPVSVQAQASFRSIDPLQQRLVAYCAVVPLAEVAIEQIGPAAQTIDDTGGTDKGDAPSFPEQLSRPLSVSPIGLLPDATVLPTHPFCASRARAPPAV